LATRRHHKEPTHVTLFQVGVRRGSDPNQVLQRIEKIDKTLTATVAASTRATKA